MLQLDLVVVQQSSKERMGRNCESMLVEGREGHDVAIRRRQRILMTGHEPLHCVGPPTEKTMLNEALHARVGDVISMEGARAFWWLWRSEGYGSRALAVD